MAVAAGSETRSKRTESKSAEEPKVGTSESQGQGRRALLLTAPAVILLTIVIVYPLVQGVIMSFQKDAGLDPATGLFVTGGFAGFSNYTHWLLQQCNGPGGTTVSCPPGSLGAQFWPAFWVTIMFTVVTVIFETLLGMWFAMIMNRKIRGRGLLRAAILIPWAIPTAVTGKVGSVRVRLRRHRERPAEL